MMKVCSCGSEIMVGTNGGVCSKCKKWHSLEELAKMEDYLHVLILGKWNGPNHFVTKLGEALKQMGHKVTHVNRFDMLKYVPDYDLRECEEFKKPIPLRGLEFEYSPDLIFVEQTYMRYKNDCKKTPVFYHHREYTHFPDLLDPDVLLFAYPCREEVFDYYYPYEYHLIKHKYNLWNGVDIDYFKPKPKIFDGLIDIGWQVEAWRFAIVNGPMAKNIIEEQERFSNYCKMKGYTNRFDAPVELEKYREILALSKAILIDGGYLGWFTRRVLEAAACKTLMVIRMYSKEQARFYDEVGLKNMENCILFDNEETLKTVASDVDYYYDMGIPEKAHEWVKQFTYDKVAKKLLNIYEEFKNGP